MLIRGPKATSLYAPVVPLVGNRLATASGVFAPALLSVAGGNAGRHGGPAGPRRGHQLRARPRTQAGLLRLPARFLPQPRRLRRCFGADLGPRGAQGPSRRAAGGWSPRAVRRRPEKIQGRPEDAGGQIPASGFGLQHQTRIYHGPLVPGARFAGQSWEKFSSDPTHGADSRRARVFQPRPPDPPRQTVAAPGGLTTAGAGVARRRCLLCL